MEGKRSGGKKATTRGRIKENDLGRDKEKYNERRCYNVTRGQENSR
jgi:hypothetical protein